MQLISGSVVARPSAIKTACLILLIGLVLPGCGGAEEFSDQDANQADQATGPESDPQNASPQVLSPLELMHAGRDEEAKDQRGTAQLTDEAQPGAAPVTKVQPEAKVKPQAETKPTIKVDVNTKNVPHPAAGRSAFPHQGEAIEVMISAQRLSAEDPFAKPLVEVPGIVPWDQAKQYLGSTITVEGKIVHTGQSRDGQVHFLNFHQEWRGKFYMVLFEDLTKTLPESVEQVFLGKTLRVTGAVEDHRGQPQIKIQSMDQVEFVGE